MIKNYVVWFMVKDGQGMWVNMSYMTSATCKMIAVRNCKKEYHLTNENSKIVSVLEDGEVDYD